MANNGFNHFDSTGKAVMVDVSGKDANGRTATAKGTITMNAETLAAIQAGSAKKGDVLGVARIGGIMAAKKTAELIPLCHPLNFESCTVDFTVDTEKLCVEAMCTIKLTGKTGAEMEALTGVSAALLTIYDMCKAMDRSMVISDICLWEKSGGKSGHFKRTEAGHG
ncbi:cyclic pyranopterin monophosphate synthase accessory protein [Spirochaetia bacterium]|nr:cyclic pyranopterin monophosphate synthase accessory protein [Spirochaetia bacterium]